MSVNEYLNDLLEFQRLGDELKILKKHREEVESFLRDEFGQDPSIKYGGSKAKGTIIRENYDLDLICYFPENSDFTIEDAYKNVKEKLQNKYLVEPKTSALRIKGLKEEEDYHIDVVPGKYIDNKSEEAFLYISIGEGQRIKTNLNTHINYIVRSRCIEIIKLCKLWRERNNIKLKTFILEILVVQALKKYSSKDNLSKAFKKVLEYMRDNIADIRLEDPANSNNIVSEGWAKTERASLSVMAGKSLELIAGDRFEEEDSWRQIFKERIRENVAVAPIIINRPHKPYCEG